MLKSSEPEGEALVRGIKGELGSVLRRKI